VDIMKYTHTHTYIYVYIYIYIYEDRHTDRKKEVTFLRLFRKTHCKN
jgi:hypothetical protein